jgi:hypothetical protein
MFEAVGSKLWRRDHLQWHGLLTEFQENLPTGSKVIYEGHTEG